MQVHASDARISGSGAMQAHASDARVSGSGARVSGNGARVSGNGARVSGSGQAPPDLYPLYPALTTSSLTPPCLVDAAYIVGHAATSFNAYAKQDVWIPQEQIQITAASGALLEQCWVRCWRNWDTDLAVELVGLARHMRQMISSHMVVVPAVQLQLVGACYRLVDTMAKQMAIDSGATPQSVLGLPCGQVLDVWVPRDTLTPMMRVVCFVACVAALPRYQTPITQAHTFSKLHCHLLRRPGNLCTIAVAYTSAAMDRFATRPRPGISDDELLDLKARAREAAAKDRAGDTEQRRVSGTGSAGGGSAAKGQGYRVSGTGSVAGVSAAQGQGYRVSGTGSAGSGSAAQGQGYRVSGTGSVAAGSGRLVVGMDGMGGQGSGRMSGSGLGMPGSGHPVPGGGSGYRVSGSDVGIPGGGHGLQGSGRMSVSGRMSNSGRMSASGQAMAMGTTHRLSETGLPVPGNSHRTSASGQAVPVQAVGAMQLLSQPQPAFHSQAGRTSQPGGPSHPTIIVNQSDGEIEVMGTTDSAPGVSVAGRAAAASQGVRLVQYGLQAASSHDQLAAGTTRQGMQHGQFWSRAAAQHDSGATVGARQGGVRRAHTGLSAAYVQGGAAGPGKAQGMAVMNSRLGKSQGLSLLASQADAIPSSRSAIHLASHQHSNGHHSSQDGHAYHGHHTSTHLPQQQQAFTPTRSQEPRGLYRQPMTPTKSHVSSSQENSLSAIHPSVTIPHDEYEYLDTTEECGGPSESDATTPTGPRSVAHPVALPVAAPVAPSAPPRMAVIVTALPDLINEWHAGGSMNLDTPGVLTLGLPPAQVSITSSLADSGSHLVLTRLAPVGRLVVGPSAQMSVTSSCRDSMGPDAHHTSSGLYGVIGVSGSQTATPALLLQAAQATAFAALAQDPIPMDLEGDTPPARPFIRLPPRPEPNQSPDPNHNPDDNNNNDSDDDDEAGGPPRLIRSHNGAVRTSSLFLSESQVLSSVFFPDDSAPNSKFRPEDAPGSQRGGGQVSQLAVFGSTSRAPSSKGTEGKPPSSKGPASKGPATIAALAVTAAAAAPAMIVVAAVAVVSPFAPVAAVPVASEARPKLPPLLPQPQPAVVTTKQLPPLPPQLESPSTAKLEPASTSKLQEQQLPAEEPKQPLPFVKPVLLIIPPSEQEPQLVSSAAEQLQPELQSPSPAQQLESPVPRVTTRHHLAASPTQPDPHPPPAATKQQPQLEVSPADRADPSEVPNMSVSRAGGPPSSLLATAGTSPGALGITLPMSLGSERVLASPMLSPIGRGTGRPGHTSSDGRAYRASGDGRASGGRMPRASGDGRASGGRAARVSADGRGSGGRAPRVSGDGRASGGRRRMTAEERRALEVARRGGLMLELPRPLKLVALAAGCAAAAVMAADVASVAVYALNAGSFSSMNPQTLWSAGDAGSPLHAISRAQAVILIVLFLAGVAWTACLAAWWFVRTRGSSAATAGPQPQQPLDALVQKHAAGLPALLPVYQAPQDGSGWTWGGCWKRTLSTCGGGWVGWQGWRWSHLLLALLRVAAVTPFLSTLALPVLFAWDWLAGQAYGVAFPLPIIPHLTTPALLLSKIYLQLLLETLPSMVVAIWAYSHSSCQGPAVWTSRAPAPPPPPQDQWCQEQRVLRQAMLAVLVSGAVACGLALMMGIMHLSSKRSIMMGGKEDKPAPQMGSAPYPLDKQATGELGGSGRENVVRWNSSAFDTMENGDHSSAQQPQGIQAVHAQSNGGLRAPPPAHRQSDSGGERLPRQSDSGMRLPRQSDSGMRLPPSAPRQSDNGSRPPRQSDNGMRAPSYAPRQSDSGMGLPPAAPRKSETGARAPPASFTGAGVRSGHHHAQQSCSTPRSPLGLPSPRLPTDAPLEHL